MQAFFPLVINLTAVSTWLRLSHGTAYCSHAALERGVHGRAHRPGLRAITLVSPAPQHVIQFRADPRHAIIVYLVRRIPRGVIPAIAEQRGVGDHQRGHADLGEGPVIRPVDALQETRRAAADAGAAGVFAEGADRTADEAA